MPDQESLAAARDLIAFIDASPTPYHAVQQVAERLKRAGFVALDERENWDISPGTKAYVVRGGGSIVAFVAGAKPPSAAGFILVGAHTDSPNMRIKPVPDLTNVGYRQLAIEVYGGVLFSTWLDRDLCLAGRVVLRDGRSELLRLPMVVGRIPNLAIHLDREVNQRGLILNPQNHLVPVLALEGGVSAATLAQLVAQGLRDTGVNGALAEDILAYDLCLFDAQNGVIGGSSGEFIFSARLDNLASCHAACEALIASGSTADATRGIVLYDHEEVGSRSATGAQSLFLNSVLERIASAYGDTSGDLSRAFARSLLISADMAHAVHPNYADKHDRQHRPMIGGGPVIKINVNQSYATDSPGAASFVAACKRCDVAPQYFVSRNDMPCGSTIGPISAARIGMRALDVGNAMLSMHSAREMAGSADVGTMIAVLTRMLADFVPLNPAF